MKTVGLHISRSLLATVAIAGLWLFVLSSPAGAAASCDRVASTSGADGSAGTAGAPWKTPQYMADHLAPGQTGCFRAGTYAFSNETDVSQHDITLTSYPGERATLRGGLKLEPGADQATVSDLNLDVRSSSNIGPFVFAANATFDNVDVTNYHSEICFILGSNSGQPAVHTVIENSRIHDCGKLPSQNGDHGIYAAHAREAIIRNNWIYDNADRGIQLYPDSQGSQVYDNVIDGNGEGIIISGDGNTASSNNVVHDNVISNSRIRWNVESSWPNGVVGTGNVVRDNCVWASNPTSQSDYYNHNGGILPRNWGGEGFTTLGNVIANPQFVNVAARNLELAPGSPCAGPRGFVTLKTDDNQVSSGDAVTLVGHASPPQGGGVTIQILRHGHWRRFAHTTLKPNGKFTLHRRIGRRVASGRARLRAKVPRVGSSRPVAIRVRA